MGLAYGAVLTLIDLIDRIPAHHARFPTLFSMEQLGELESIKEKACFIQNYLEVHSLGLDDSSEAQDLKRRILDVSNEAAYVIDTLILDDIEAPSSSETKKKMHLYHVLHFMDCIMKEMMEIEDLQPNNLTSTQHSTSIAYPTIYVHDAVVGLDGRMIQIMDKLTGGKPDLQVIPITGMGGIGKTTLAQTIYDNSLIMISEWTSLRTMKTCNVHDLLRDLCIHEADKEELIPVNEKTILKSKLVIRSRYVRVLHEIYYDSTDEEGYINLLNVRLLHTNLTHPETSSLVHRLWNLQTLVIQWHVNQGHVNNKDLTIPIWKMPHLRHFIVRRNVFGYISIDLPLPGDSVLEYLQTLRGVRINSEVFEEIFSRIPNVKVLSMRCDTTNSLGGGDGEYGYFKSYGHLLKLESLTLQLFGDGEEEFIKKSVFPDSIKKLKLIWPDCSLDEISKRIGWLPNLEELSLVTFYSKEDWNPVEGQFLQLKVLKLDCTCNVLNWNAESVHFPVLEHLHLKSVRGLEEIPYGIGEIETLKSITLTHCKDSVGDSAKEILEKQKSNGNDDFRLTIDSKKI